MAEEKINTLRRARASYGRFGGTHPANSCQLASDSDRGIVDGEGCGKLRAVSGRCDELVRNGRGLSVEAACQSDPYPVMILQQVCGETVSTQPKMLDGMGVRRAVAFDRAFGKAE